MNKICGIYKITSPTGKIYIGQSRNINLRIKYYKNAWCKDQQKIYNSIIKYGWEAHKTEIICECNLDELDDLEKYYINFYNTFDTKHGLNLTNGGTTGKLLSKQTKEKISDIHKNQIVKSETRIKLSLAIKGIKRSLETIEKMRKVKTGLKHTEKTKQKIRDNKCHTYEIYDNNALLTHKFHSNIKKELKKLNLPECLCKTYRNNNKLQRGKHKGWYIIKL